MSLQRRLEGLPVVVAAGAHTSDGRSGSRLLAESRAPCCCASRGCRSTSSPVARAVAVLGAGAALQGGREGG
jgi:hypothetical protein